MSECLGDARYSKSIYALLSRSIVRSLLCYRVRDNDHCCVLCDVTRDLLFAKYIVHQPNVYQYGVLIFLASLRQGLDYLPVNSKTSYPPGIPRAFFRTVGNLTQNEARPVGHWLSCQNVGQRFVQRVHHVQGLLTSLLLYSLFYCSISESFWSYVQTDATLLANNSQHCVRLHVAWKSPLNVGFLKWTMLLEWTNLRKTVFLALRYFGCVGGNLDLNKWFDAWGKFFRWWSAGFDTFWSGSRWGIWPSKLPTYPGIWPKPFKKSQIPRGLRGGMGSFIIDWYIMSATWRRLTESLKPGFHMIATKAAIAEKKRLAIAAIIWKPDFS